MKGRKRSIIDMYHCQACDTDFLSPIKSTKRVDTTVFVCPECKSRKWGNIYY